MRRLFYGSKENISIFSFCISATKAIRLKAWRMPSFLILLILILVSCQSDSQTAKSIDMYNASGDMVGTAKFTEQPDGVKIKIKVEGLSPGFHGIHVHEFP